MVWPAFGSILAGTALESQFTTRLHWASLRRFIAVAIDAQGYDFMEIKPGLADMYSPQRSKI
jgi:hypothetical protein